LFNTDGAAPFTFTASDTSAALGPLPGPSAQADASIAAHATTAATSTDTPAAWTDATSAPGGRRAAGAARCTTDPNVTYLLGGKTAVNPLTKRSWRYDAADDSWTELARIPATSASMRAVCEAGKIHVFLGDEVNRHLV